MPRIRLSLFAALLSAAPSIAASAAPVEVTVDGAVQAPGVYQLSTGGRIADAIAAAKPRQDAYVLGAMLLNERARAEQLRLKAGLAYDLHALQESGPKKVHTHAARLASWLEQQTVTGRVPALNLDVRLMLVQTSINPEAEHGDTVFYPSRPDTVRVIGAVHQDCELPQQPLADATEYVKACGIEPVADPNTVYVIQPDGHVQPIGIALWNRADAYPVAPGGTVYVPLAERLLKDIDPAFNAEFARFIATQPPTSRVTP